MDIMTLSHNDLIELVRQQQMLIAEQAATIERLERRVRELEGGEGPPRGIPGHKRQQTPRADRPPRRKRSENHARRRGEPTARVVHALASCPDCGILLAGGSIKRRREVIEITPAPVTVTEHVYLERGCPGCGKRWTPRVALAGEVVGQSRLGIGLLSLIATLREEARLPMQAIQLYLKCVHGLALSVGGIVGALGQVARIGQATREQILRAIRASPVFYADETGWRQNGANGYLWTLSTLDARYYRYGGRGNAVVDHLLGIDTAEEAVGILVSDFYAAYNHYPGVQQKCWVHLLRDIHEVVRQHPDAAGLATWAAQVRAIYDRAVAFRSADDDARHAMRQHLMAELAALCQGEAASEEAPQAVLCRRIEKHLHSLFVFVLEPAVAADNNAAERSLRHLVISRKISGGTRSQQGTDIKVTLATLFGTWRARGLNPFTACQDLLSSPKA